MDAKNTFVISYLHKAIKALNQLRMIEDAVVIYRLSRAPERRIFYIDVGNLPKGKAEQYMKSIMTQYRNKLVYDANTGELRDERKHLSMLEDFWLPRREGGKGTEITTLPAGQNLGQMEDVQYFQKKLLQSLNVPISRLDPQVGAGIMGVGKTTEVTRDEVKFSKFINRLRNKFSRIFDDALRIQLSLKGICTVEEWEDFKESIYYDYKKDNNFAEMREAEVLRERVLTATQLDPFIGRYYSSKWIKKNVLRMTEEEIEEMEKEIKEEGDSASPVLGGDANAAQTGADAEAEAVDNTTDGTGQETETPQLDDAVNKYAFNINKK
jgi:hypothetical protein